MRKVLYALSALAVSAVASAQITGVLDPAGGTFYPQDVNHQGVIGITYSAEVGHFEKTDSTYEVVAPVATIEVGNHRVVLDAHERGTTGLYWGIAVGDTIAQLVKEPTAMKVTVTATADGETVETLVGNYTFNPNFPLESISPENYSELTSKDQTVEFTFREKVSYSAIEISSGDELIRTLPAGSGEVVPVAISASDWAEIGTEWNDISIRLLDVELADGTPVSNVAGETNMVMATYFYKEEVKFQYLGVYPAEDEATYQEVYDNYWYVNFMFNEAVAIPEEDNAVCAYVTFFDKTGMDIDELELTSWDVYGNWNYRAGYYVVQVAIPEVPSKCANYSYAVVELNGVTYNDKLIAPQPSAKYKAALPSRKLISNNYISGEAASANIVLSENEPNKIYNLQGVLISDKASDINTLGKGVYVVNGKKIVIK